MRASSSWIKLPFVVRKHVMNTYQMFSSCLWLRPSSQHLILTGTDVTHGAVLYHGLVLYLHLCVYKYALIIYVCSSDHTVEGWLMSLPYNKELTSDPWF